MALGNHWFSNTVMSNSTNAYPLYTASVASNTVNFTQPIHYWLEDKMYPRTPLGWMEAELDKIMGEAWR